MTISTGSGCSVAIGTTLAINTDQDEATVISEFESDTYIEVGEVEDLGEFGDESPEVPFTSLADSRVRKLKGARDAGTLTVTSGADHGDEGQEAMIAAEAEPHDYNFRVTLNDPDTLGGTPSVHYFRGKVMGKRLNVGNANNVLRRNFTVGVNTAIFEQAPT